MIHQTALRVDLVIKFCIVSSDMVSGGRSAEGDDSSLNMKNR